MILQILEKLGVPIYNSYGQFRSLINIIEDLQQAIMQLNRF